MYVTVLSRHLIQLKHPPLLVSSNHDLRLTDHCRCLYLTRSMLKDTHSTMTNMTKSKSVRRWTPQLCRILPYAYDRERKLTCQRVPLSSDGVLAPYPRRTFSSVSVPHRNQYLFMDSEYWRWIIISTTKDFCNLERRCRMSDDWLKFVLLYYMY